MVQPADMNRENVVFQQALEVRALYPEFFQYVADREKVVSRAVSRIPHPSDPELIVSGGELSEILGRLRGLPPGVGDLIQTMSREGRS